MNRQELEHMLSLTDEAHLSEIYDSNETITETVSESHKSKPMTLRIAAVAAAFVLCVGGGVLLWQRLNRLHAEGGQDFLTYPVDGQNSGSDPGYATSTADPLLEVGTTIERENYILTFAEMTGYSEINSTLRCGGRSYPLEHPDLPFDTSIFTSFDGAVYCDESGIPINSFLSFEEGYQTLSLYISDNGIYFSDAITNYQPPENPENKPVLVMYYGSFDSEHIICVDMKQDGIQYTLKMANFPPQEVEQYAAALLESGITSQDLFEQAVDTSEYFPGTTFFQGEAGGVEVQEYDLHGVVLETHDMPFSLEPYTFAGVELFLREDGSPVNACIALKDENGNNLNLFVETRRYRFLTELMNGDGGVVRNSVRIFGSHPSATVSQLAFRVHGVDFVLHGVGTNDIDLLLLSDQIIDYVLTHETYVTETEIIRCPVE